MPESHAVRKAAVAGMFYPGDPAVLKRDVDGLLDAVPPQRSGRPIVALVAPHAGYVYSGGTAARAYARLRGASYETVVVVSPSHREYFEGASVYPGGAYATPLGPIPIDAGLRDALVQSCPLVSVSAHGHRSEHAVEVQLPFLQRALGPFRLLPIVIGNQRRSVCFELGECLGKLLKGRSALLVASKIKSNVRELEGALNRVCAFASMHRRPVSLELVKEALKDVLHVEPPVITVESIQKVVADYHNLKVSELKSKNNAQEFAFPRQIAMYLCKSLTDKSLPEIGRRFGGKHHSTVIHAIRKIEDKRSREQEFDRLITTFTEMFQ